MDSGMRMKRWAFSGVLPVFGLTWALHEILAGLHSNRFVQDKLALAVMLGWWLLGMAVIRPVRKAWAAGDYHQRRNRARWLLGMVAALSTCLIFSVLFQGTLTLFLVDVHSPGLFLGIAAGQWVGGHVSARGRAKKQTHVALHGLVVSCALVIFVVMR